MKIKIEIDMDNAAFGDERWEQTDQLRALLRDLTSQFEGGHDSGVLRDSNGNTVGHWEVTR